MSNLTVIPNNKEEISNILSKKITSIIIGVNDLSIYDCTLSIEEIISLADNTDKEVIIAINKMIHNKDLKLVKETLNKVKTSKIKKILFYDVGIIKIVNDMNINKDLIISQEHLNASINSNNFYHKNGVNNVFITSDISYQEVLEIKENTNTNVYYTVYGYLPIFYSRRLLLTNYFKYINQEMQDDKYYIYNNNLKYLIKERNFGTIIYSPLINLLNNISKIKKLNLVIDLSYCKDISIIDKFINEDKVEDSYQGFFNTKTTYKLKEDNNEK